MIGSPTSAPALDWRAVPCDGTPRFVWLTELFTGTGPSEHAPAEFSLKVQEPALQFLIPRFLCSYLVGSLNPARFHDAVLDFEVSDQPRQPLDLRVQFGVLVCLRGLSSGLESGEPMPQLEDLARDAISVALGSLGHRATPSDSLVLQRQPPDEELRSGLERNLPFQGSPQEAHLVEQG